MIGFILGMFFGAFLVKMIHKVRNIDHINFTFMGYNIDIIRSSNDHGNVVHFEEKESHTRLKTKTGTCNTCDDEDLYIKGTNSIMPCPTCGRNKDKVKVELQ